MGCISSRFMSSRTVVEDTSRPIFHVWNIDEDGHYIKSCYIQVTDTDLILYQRGEPPIVWPLQSLRRYGFDTELFSFECGKRCSTGPGIYAFKCKQAESLFNALQECLLVPRSDSEAVSNGNGEETEPHSSVIGDSESNGTGSLLIKDSEKHELGLDRESIVNGHPVLPTAPVATPCLVRPHKKKRRCLTQMELLAQKSNKGLPPLGTFHGGTKFLPRCCAIGTCINASKQHYLNDKVLCKTTCGSCRTCSLNMCVVQKNASAVTYSDRAKQTDYGNVLDHGGHPKNCVHCCCDFKPTQKMGCSADDCPLHFNNCVDQVTNYARLDSHNRVEHGERVPLKKEKGPMQPPYTHVYTHIPTPVPRWPKTKSMSWRSLPHFSMTSSLNRPVAPKRSASHFYANVSEASKEKLQLFASLKGEKGRLEEPATHHAKPGLEEKRDSDTSLAVLSSLSNSPKGSDLDVYAKIDFDKTGLKQSTGNQTNFDGEEREEKIDNFQNQISCGTQT